MDLEIKHTIDSLEKKTSEIAETATRKTNEFHNNYTSRLIPDCGKYGDVAKFSAELVPGVSEYNAVREGDWQAFAIAAGIDVAAVAAGTFTAGAGYAAVKGGTAAAKAGVKVAVKEVAETGAKRVAKETIETGTQKAVKEVAETGAEKAVKESVEKTIEKSTKEVGELMDKKLFPDYLKDVEEITKRELDPKQLEKLEDSLRTQDYVKLSPEEAARHRQSFDKEKLIKEWEENTGKDWPVYTEDVPPGAEEVCRRAGQPLDAHHLIELSFGGPNEWWNLHPAAFPAEHQAGIHGVGSLARKIF